MKKIILACILSLFMAIFPVSTATAFANSQDTFDLNSVDSQSSEIIVELKESEEVIYYEETSESITFYIEEPILDQSNNILEQKDYPKLYTAQSRAGTRGVTKIVWLKGYSNFNLYLSASAKTAISTMSVGAATGFLGSFIPGGHVVGTVVGTVTSLLTGKVYSRGSVYVFRNGAYRYSYLQ